MAALASGFQSRRFMAVLAAEIAAVLGVVGEDGLIERIAECDIGGVAAVRRHVIADRAEGQFR